METIETAVLLFCTTHSSNNVEDHFLTNLHPVSRWKIFEGARIYCCLSLTHSRSNNAEETKYVC